MEAARHDFRLSSKQLGAICGVDTETMNAFSSSDAASVPEEQLSASPVVKRIMLSLTAAVPSLRTVVQTETAEAHAAALADTVRITREARNDEAQSLLGRFNLQTGGQMIHEVLEYLCEFVPPDVLLRILGREFEEGCAEETLTELLGHPPWFGVEEDAAEAPTQSAQASSASSA